MCFLTFSTLWNERWEDCQLFRGTVGGYYFFEEEREKEKAVLATNGKLLRPFPFEL